MSLIFSRLFAVVLICLSVLHLPFNNPYTLAISIVMLALFFMVEMICDAIRSLKEEKE